MAHMQNREYSATIVSVSVVIVADDDCSLVKRLPECMKTESAQRRSNNNTYITSSPSRVTTAVQSFNSSPTRLTADGWGRESFLGCVATYQGRAHSAVSTTCAGVCD